MRRGLPLQLAPGVFVEDGGSRFAATTRDEARLGLSEWRDCMIHSPLVGDSAIDSLEVRDAPIEPAANVGFRDVVPTEPDTVPHPLDGQIRVRQPEIHQ